MSPTIVKGWRALIFATQTGTATYTKVGYAESATMDIDTPVDEYLVVGEFQPKDISEGPAVLSGSLTEAWVTTDRLSLVYGPLGAGQTKWNIYAYENVSGQNVYVWAYHCLIESLSLDIPADGFLTSAIDFRATYWRYGSL